MSREEKKRDELTSGCTATENCSVSSATSSSSKVTLKENEEGEESSSFTDMELKRKSCDAKR